MPDGMTTGQFFRAITADIRIRRNVEVERLILLQPRPVPKRRHSVTSRAKPRKPVKSRRRSAVVPEQAIEIDENFRRMLDERIEQGQANDLIEIHENEATAQNNDVEEVQQIASSIDAPVMKNRTKVPFTVKGRKPKANKEGTTGNSIELIHLEIFKQKEV